MTEPIPPGMSAPEVLATVELIEADERADVLRPFESSPEVPEDVQARAVEAVTEAFTRQRLSLKMFGDFGWPASVRDAVRQAYYNEALLAVNACVEQVYAAGVRHGLDVAETLDETVIEDRAAAKLDALLFRLDADEDRRILGELIDRHPQTEDLLDPAPFIRRAQLEAIIRAVWQLLGVVDAW